MGFIRPATPGFIVTLVAAALLAVVSFCVPYFKSVYFLKATISQQGINGSITFGTLGYCTDFLGNVNCSKPSIGYELDVNGLLGIAGNKLDIKIPQVAVKWITYALFLHVVALALAVGSAVFGLLAHVREMSMACCSTCVSGFAAAVALLAFIFDLVLFFVAKARINAVGSAQMGNAIWLTLAAWVLLFFSGCFYTIGRCCISNRPSGGKGSWGNRNKDDTEYSGRRDNHAEQMRLDAVKAEADWKARQKAAESDLPAFSETQPLTARVEGDNVYIDDFYKDSNPSTPSTALHGRPVAGNGGYVGGGYIQAPAGTRAVDEYYSPSQNNNTYPPQPQPTRQGSTHTAAPSMYSNTTSRIASPPQRQPSGYVAGAYGPVTTSPPPMNQQYGHAAGGSSYHTASPHVQEPSSYSPYDPYNNNANQYSEPAFNPTTYNSTGLLSGAAAASTYAAQPNPYITSPPQPTQPERSYTLGGDGYGANSVPPLQEHNSPASYNPYGAVDTRTAYAPAQPQSPVGPRSQPVVLSPPRTDSPPGYDAGTSGVTGNWGKH